MKRFLQRLSLLLAVLLLLTTAVFADFGPKPQLVVRVEQPPQEEHYLDLLDMGDWAKNLYDLDERELDPALLAALRAAVPSGWHACIAQGSTRAPIWGELTGEPDGSGAMLHSFRYYGVPETYRILMVTASGETFLSDVLTRRTLQSSVTVDWTAKTAKPPLQSVGYLLQFAATFVPTILIELVVLLLFGFKLKENWKPFLLVNLVTQGLLHGYFALFAVRSCAACAPTSARLRWAFFWQSRSGSSSYPSAEAADHIKNRGSQFFCLPRPLFSGCFSAALFFYSKN